MENALIGPVLGQVAITFIAWLVLYARRLPAMAASKPTNEQMQDKANLAKLPAKARFAADNYNHQFEMPVLFYVLCFAAMAASAVDGMMVSLAWAYVALRAVHALIQMTYNTVMHRFFVFTISGIVLVVMFVKLAMTYWG
ncbi:MAG: MAPEG family protein [Alphaproteobacteria bacterium]|nr:MAPEG family protein [Alphaproteobacteria bacterium]